MRILFNCVAVIGTTSGWRSCPSLVRDSSSELSLLYRGKARKLDVYIVIYGRRSQKLLGCMSKSWHSGQQHCGRHFGNWRDWCLHHEYAIIHRACGGNPHPGESKQLSTALFHQNMSVTELAIRFLLCLLEDMQMIWRLKPSSLYSCTCYESHMLSTLRSHCSLLLGSISIPKYVSPVKNPPCALQVRSSAVQTRQRPSSELPSPMPKLEYIKTFEASLWLGSIAGAGFNVSRLKITNFLSWWSQVCS